MSKRNSGGISLEDIDAQNLLLDYTPSVSAQQYDALLAIADVAHAAAGTGIGVPISANKARKSQFSTLEDIDQGAPTPSSSFRVPIFTARHTEAEIDRMAALERLKFRDKEDKRKRLARLKRRARAAFRSLPRQQIGFRVWDSIGRLKLKNQSKLFREQEKRDRALDRAARRSQRNPDHKKVGHMLTDQQLATIAANKAAAVALLNKKRLDAKYEADRAAYALAQRMERQRKAEYLASSQYERDKQRDRVHKEYTDRLNRRSREQALRERAQYLEDHGARWNPETLTYIPETFYTSQGPLVGQAYADYMKSKKYKKRII